MENLIECKSLLYLIISYNSVSTTTLFIESCIWTVRPFKSRQYIVHLCHGLCSLVQVTYLCFRTYDQEVASSVPIPKAG